MASELSKLIEDQLQKVDEESGVAASTEKQRLLSSSLRIKTSPGKKPGKGSPGIVKMSKEQPSPPSISGTSVPVPSGHSWVTDGQGFQWTKWRIAVAVGIVAAIVIALFVAFSHPSSKIHHPNLTGFSQGNTSQPLIAGSPAGSNAAVQQQKTKSTQHPIVEEHAQAAVEHSLLKSPEPDALLSAPAAQSSSAEAGHHKAHPGQHPHKNHPHAHPGQHAGVAAAAHGLPALAPALVPLPAAPLTAAAALPPSTVPAMAPEAVAAWFGVGGPTAGAEAPGAGAPGGMDDSAWVGLTAGIHRAVPGVAGNPLDTVQQPVNVQDSVIAGANDAFDKLHGGNWNGQLEQQQQGNVEGVAGVTGVGGEMDGEEWLTEEDGTDMEVAGGLTGQEGPDDAAG
ncbi:g8231 [Coccomyxa elongata]